MLLYVVSFGSLWYIVYCVIVLQVDADNSDDDSDYQPDVYVVADFSFSCYLLYVYKKSHFVFLHKSLSCLLYTSPSPRDGLLSRMPSSA